MFDKKNENEDYSSDELELMKMIKEYERDEAEEKHAQVFQEEAHQEVVREERVPTYSQDSALDSDSNHTKVMSREAIDADKTLTIMSMGNQASDTAVEETQPIPTQPQPVEEDDDPRFELKRNKDKKKKDKKKKGKNAKSEDERLNKAILILMIVAGIVVLLCGGYLIYNSFFRDSDSSTKKDEKTEEVTPKKNTTTDKKNNTTTTTPKENETTPPKEDHSAEIAALQKLIDQETLNANDFTKKADEAQTALNTYNTTKATHEKAVADAQKIVDEVEAAKGTPTEAQTKAVADAKSALEQFLTSAAIPSQSTIDENRTKANNSFAKIEDYRKQIAAFQQ